MCILSRSQCIKTVKPPRWNIKQLQLVSKLLRINKNCLKPFKIDLLTNWNHVAHKGIGGQGNHWFMPWWRHQMEAFSAWLALCEGNPPVTGGFPPQRPFTRSFDVLFDLRLHSRLSKQSRRRWFEIPSHSLLGHCNGNSLSPVRCLAITRYDAD